MSLPHTSQNTATPLADRTAVISPNGGLTRWFIGLLCLIVLLIGCGLASQHSGEANLYPLGLLIAGLGLGALVLTIKRGFDHAERHR